MNNICANKECGKEFSRSTFNQKYCDHECCRVATNARIKAKYHETRDRMKDPNRRCSRCGTSMSRYNMDLECGPCKQSVFSGYNQQILELLGVK